MNRALLFGTTLALALAGCSTVFYPELPTAPSRPSITADPDQYSYLIGPGDALNIFVWRNPEISGTFTVRPDGMITTSLVEDIPVTGKTPTQLAREIESVLSVYIREPIVTVTVGGFGGPYSEQVRLVGAASTPMAMNYRQHMTLLDALIQVGGITEFAAGNSAHLFRIENGERVHYRLRIDDLLRYGDISANVDLLPGDTIVIPEAWF